jgi:hypothetical protein
MTNTANAPQASYDRTAAARTYTRRVQITFGYGMKLACEMDLSIADMENLRRDGDIEPDATCVDCGGHVTECPEIAPLLLDWPERAYSTTWGGDLTQAELNNA